MYVYIKRGMCKKKIYIYIYVHRVGPPTLTLGFQGSLASAARGPSRPRVVRFVANANRLTRTPQGPFHRGLMAINSGYLFGVY